MGGELAEGVPSGRGRIAPRAGAGSGERERGSWGRWRHKGLTLDFALASPPAAGGILRGKEEVASGTGGRLWETSGGHRLEKVQQRHAAWNPQQRLEQRAS